MTIRLVTHWPMSERIAQFGTTPGPDYFEEPWIEVETIPEIAEKCHRDLMSVMANETRFDTLAIMAGLVAWANLASTFIGKPKLGRTHVIAVDMADKPFTFLDVPLYLCETIGRGHYHIAGGGDQLTRAILRRYPCVGKVRP